MTRAILLATSATLALFTLSPSAFSAAVVHNGSLASPGEAGSFRLVSPRDLARLNAAMRGDFMGPRMALTNLRLGSGQTLTGASAEVAGPTVALPDRLSDITGSDAKDCPALPGAVSTQAAAAAPAPVAAADGVGSASAFGAVPEPSSLVLLALGAGSLLRRRRS